MTTVHIYCSKIVEHRFRTIILAEINCSLKISFFQMPCQSPSSTYCNKPWKVFFEGTGINSEEVWIGVVSNRIQAVF